MQLSRSLLFGLAALGFACQAPSVEDCPSGVDCSEGRSVPDTCGNGTVEIGEECDDQNDVPGDGCENDCSRTRSICGNGILDPGELCDDHNTISGDGCRSDCVKVEVCGDGDLDASEVCDDGEAVSGDGCRADCQGEELCGDGLLDVAAGELCDDGNNIDGDGCSSDCTSDEVCGNGVASQGEQCDDGNGVDGDGCDINCTQSACGNEVAAPGEQCFENVRLVNIPSYGSPQPRVYGGSTAVADLDGDGDLDIAAAADYLSWAVAFLVNDGGNYTTQLLYLSQPVNQVMVADLNYDGRPDLILTNIDTGKISVSYQQSALQFSQPSVIFEVAPMHSYTSQQDWRAVPIVLEDYDRDGHLDITVSGDYYGYGAVYGLHNDVGAFTWDSILIWQETPVGRYLFTDADGDGDRDLLTTNRVDEELHIYTNLGPYSYNFRSAVTLNSIYPLDMVSGDFDQDGDNDLAFAQGEYYVVAKNNGGFDFVFDRFYLSNQAGNGVLGLTPADFDGDGDLDLALNIFPGQGVQISHNDGSGRFEDAPALLNSGGVDAQASAGDINQDGLPDLALVSRSYTEVGVLYSNP